MEVVCVMERNLFRHKEIYGGVLGANLRTKRYNEDRNTNRQARTKEQPRSLLVPWDKN